VATTFAFRDEACHSLADAARLDSMVTVVDALNLTKDYSSRDFLSDRGQSLEGDERTVVDLLVEQIEFADTIVLNKVADAAPSQLADARAIVRSLNPAARLIEASFGRVPLAEVLGTGRFDMERAAQFPGWARELYGFKNHVPETEAYGIGSITFRERRPLHPARFHAFLDSDWPGVLRAKGFFWLATRPGFVGEMSMAGAIMRTQAHGRWYASVPRERWPADPTIRRRILERWDPLWGDRRQEIVLIGRHLDRSDLRGRLEACLLTDREIAQGELAWRRYPDPFPRWGAAAA